MAKHDDDAIWNLFGRVGGVSLIVLVSTVFRGYVFSVLWLWFAVPFGVMPITVVHGIGISVLFRLLMPHQFSNKTDNDTKFTWEPLLTEFLTVNLAIAITWGMGAILNALM